MDNYREILTEINSMVEKIVSFETQILANKDKIKESIVVIKQHITEQVSQYEKIKKEFEFGLETVDTKFIRLLDDVRDKVDKEYKNSINEKFLILKNALNPLESKISAFNDEIVNNKDFLKETLKAEITKTNAKINDLDIMITAQWDTLKHLEENTRVFDTLNKLLSNIMAMQAEAKSRDERLNHRIDQIIEAQQEISKKINLNFEGDKK